MNKDNNSEAIIEAKAQKDKNNGEFQQPGKSEKSPYAFRVLWVIIACLILMLIGLEWLIPPKKQNPFLATSKIQNVDILAAQINQLEKNINQLQLLQEQQQIMINKTQAEIVNLAKSSVIQDKTKAASAFLLTQMCLIGQSLQLAHWYLLTQYKTQTALVLLQQASNIINQIKQPALFPVQQQLSKIILQLKLIPQVPTAEILIRLASLRNAIQSIPLIDGAINNKNNTENLSDNNLMSKGPHWLQKLKSSLNEMKGLIIIRYHEKPFEPIMPPATQTLVLQTWIQLINQASWAVIQQNSEVFQNSLTQAQQLLNAHFSSNLPEIKSLMNEINQLKLINIKPEVPDLTSVLQAFSNAMVQMQGVIPTPNFKWTRDEQAVSPRSIQVVGNEGEPEVQQSGQLKVGIGITKALPDIHDAVISPTNPVKDEKAS